MAPPPIRVRAFSHVGITVSDLDRSIDFYTRVLGFRLLTDVRGIGQARALLAVDAVTLELFEGEVGPAEMVPEPTVFGSPKLALTVDDLEQARAAAREHGLEVWGDEVFDTPVSLVCWIRDPDGTRIQLHTFKAGGARVGELFA